MKNKLRKYSKWLYWLMLVSLISCGGGDMNFNVDRGDFEFPSFRSTDSETRAAFYFEEDVGDRQKVILQGYNGNITVTGLSGEHSVIISGTKLVGSNSVEDAEEYLQELIVEVQGLENMILVKTIQPQDISRRYIVDYTITMPKDMEIEISNSNGTVTLVSIDNDITVDNKNGDVILNEIFASASVTLTNGTIDSAITLPVDGMIDLHTVNGNINLAIPADTSAELSAYVTFGSISVSNLLLQSEAGTSDFLIGTLGDGQGTITLEVEVTGGIRVLTL